jgi:hypothetical protein
MVDYKSLAPHLRKDLISAMVSAIFALTYNNMLLGFVIRRLMLHNVPSKANGDISAVMPAASMADELSRSGMSTTAA